MSRRPPPKQRHRERPQRPSPRCEQPAQDDPNGYSAPSHTAGQFDQHDYGHGHGGFGFTQYMLP